MSTFSGEDHSDLYSLGVTAFYALTGALPFDAPSVHAILAKHIGEPAPPVASIRNLPGKLAEAVDRCLLKDPQQRFQSGEELAEAVAEVGLRVREIPPHLRHLLRQGEAGGGLFGMAFVALLMLGYGFSWP
ncbi:MAG: hypothetical protein IH966_08245, partial [Gemmatimonadetes bacterium]|nr:hypothetical protein [Gemmatimonadota bacterium]